MLTSKTPWCIENSIGLCYENMSDKIFEGYQIFRNGSPLVHCTQKLIKDRLLNGSDFFMNPNHINSL